MVSVVEAIADAIMRYEGWEPTSRSYRNRNPGNLRGSSLAAGKDSDGYCYFALLTYGYDALILDLEAKITGRNTHGLSARSTLLQFFSVYAPAADHNAPQRYASFVADWLCRVYKRGDIHSSWTISDVFAAVGQELPGGVTTSQHSS